MDLLKVWQERDKLARDLSYLLLKYNDLVNITNLNHFDAYGKEPNAYVHSLHIDDKIPRSTEFHVVHQVPVLTDIVKHARHHATAARKENDHTAIDK